MKLSWFVRRDSGGASRACLFLCDQLQVGLIRVLLGWFVNNCELEYGISTFDSESFELELNGRAWDTSGSSFVQIPLHVIPDVIPGPNPFSGFARVALEIRFRPLYTMSLP